MLTTNAHSTRAWRPRRRALPAPCAPTSRTASSRPMGRAATPNCSPLMILIMCKERRRRRTTTRRIRRAETWPWRPGRFPDGRTGASTGGRGSSFPAEPLHVDHSALGNRRRRPSREEIDAPLDLFLSFFLLGTHGVLPEDRIATKATFGEIDGSGFFFPFPLYLMYLSCHTFFGCY